MFIYSVRSSTLKFCATLIGGILLVTVLVFILPSTPPEDASTSAVQYDHIESYADMAEFLRQFGWEIDVEHPISDEKVVLPQNFEGVFLKLNEIQKAQGLDLSDYAGKEVRRLVFTVKNGKEENTVAVLFVHRECVVGGFLASGEPGGFVVGFDGKEQNSSKQ